MPKAIADGPVSSGDSAAAAGFSWAAIRMRRFLTTRYATLLLRSARRISVISFTLRPRYSDTIMVLLASSWARRASIVSRLASVGIEPP